MSFPARGEIWLCDLGMTAKVRPVLVISAPFDDRDYALFHVIPHTTSPHGSTFEVAVKASCLREGAFNIQGSQSVPRSWLLRHLGTLNKTQLTSVEESFRRWLQL